MWKFDEYLEYHSWKNAEILSGLSVKFIGLPSLLLSKACKILLRGDQSARHELIGAEENGADDSLCNKYLADAASYFGSICREGGVDADLSCEEVLSEPLFSGKLLRLIGILSNFRSRPKMKCIVFVNRIVVARCLSQILQTLKFLSAWRSNFLVGVHSGLKIMSRKNMNAILEKFRSGELNLLVATKVGEEGLDIQTCCLVIRFDLPETVASFIQSRGRARMPESEYVFLVNRGNQKELKLIENFKKDEEKMNEEILSRQPSQTYADVDVNTYEVTSTGATISSGSSVSLLQHYCSRLPRDEFFIPKPEFFYFDDVEGTICRIILPSNAPAHVIVSSPQSSTEAAKKDACLKACKELHQLGALTDYLLPDLDDGKKDLEQEFSDSDSCDDEASRWELHEMLVPAVLTKWWTDSEYDICLNLYYVKLSPHPADRDYRRFALFLKEPLPREAERMTFDLFLARGRLVKTELVPLGVAKFDKDEILQAQYFQKMFLKVILDRSEFVPEFVSLGQHGDNYSGSSIHYLLLPVFWSDFDGPMNVDWKLIRRCLSSPIFGAQKGAGDKVNLCMDNCLELANGRYDVNDVINSLVYAPCKDTFFFISDVVKEKNGYSEFKDSTTHVQHYAKVLGNLLYPDQPLLKAKQLFVLDNLLRKGGSSEVRQKEEHFIELPPEICQLKILGFSRDIGSSLSLLPSILHRLESLLVAIELKDRLCSAFPEGAEVTTVRILEALTTEKCCERYSLERLEVLGDAFLKFAVGRHLFLLHQTLDEGQLTRKRSNLVNNLNLLRLAKMRRLQVYIRDQAFNPSQFYPLGRPCPVKCSEERETELHASQENSLASSGDVEIRCNKGHHWLQKKIIADVVEALVGAFLVDSGFKAASAFLKWIGIQVDFKVSQVSKICSSSTLFEPLSAHLDIPALENLLGYQFIHKGLLLQAFIHPSYNEHLGGCYQRLEFLGDAVLDYLITSYLFSVYPKLKPGQLTDLRSLSVNNNSFANIAVGRSFHKFIICDSSCLHTSMSKYADFIKTSASKKDVDDGPSCPKVLGDLVESSIGAILLDTGFDLNHVWRIMLSFMDGVMNFSNLQINPIRELQELCQYHGWDLQIPSLKRDKTYSIEARVKGENVCETARADNLSKKAATRVAAQELCRMFKARGYKPKAKSLEEVLKSSRKMAAKLIGYDEPAINITAPDAVPLGSLRLAGNSESQCNPRVHPASEELKKTVQPSVRSVRKSQPRSERQGVQLRSPTQSRNCNSESLGTGDSNKKTARSNLFEICAANCWKPPIIECCQETGPSHLKEFTFKVTLEILEDSDVVAAYGAPHLTKKDAAEHAAEGAIWYLKKAGYLHDRK